jgi:GNAT superfamily N-acetyltransferase
VATGGRARLTIRNVTPADYGAIATVVDDWWGGREIAPLLHRLFFEHFSTTSFVVEDDRGVVAFLCGFLSQSHPAEAYVHLVGVRPDVRHGGLGRRLYEHFADVARREGRTLVRAVTAPANAGSIAFHRRLGFDVRVVSFDDGTVTTRVEFCRRI